MDGTPLKQTYRIGETSGLFGIGADSLRYYERLGIVVPRREPNGYRVYDLSDMYKLTIIKELRGLGFSMKQIAEYLEGQNVDKTIAMLEDEHAIIERKLDELKRQQVTLAQRVDTIRKAKGARIGAIEIVDRPRRRCMKMAGHLERDEEMDLLIQELHRRSGSTMPHLLTVPIGAFLAQDAIMQGATNVYDGIFFIVEDEKAPANFELPAGQYLTTRYQGGYEQNGRLLIKLLDFAREHALPLAGQPFELYEIDNRDTADEREFITTMELPLDAKHAD